MGFVGWGEFEGCEQAGEVCAVGREKYDGDVTAVPLLSVAWI